MFKQIHVLLNKMSPLFFKEGLGVVIAISMFLVFPAIVKAGTVELPKTGQTTCYDTAGSVISCTGTGQDGELLSGVAWPSPRFTVGTGIEADCVTDHLTGLMWVKSPDKFIKTWQEALDYSNGLNLCGYTDWRLPNVIELESLINSEEPEYAAWLFLQGFDVDVALSDYWSSTSYAVDPSLALNLNSFDATISYDSKLYGYHHTWPVRSAHVGAVQLWKTGQTTCWDTNGVLISCAGTGQDGDIQAGAAWPSPRFNVSGECVTDNLSGLMWVKSSYNLMVGTWQDALDYANGLDLCGYTDWHLPNKTEFLSLIDYSQYNPALPSGHPFLNFPSGDYWSSTSHAKFPAVAWSAEILTGIMGGGEKWVGNAIYAWPVRSGKGVPIVDVTLVPDATSFIRGGTAGYSVTVKNNTNILQTFKYWTYVILPNGNRYPATGEYLGPVNVTLNPGQTKNAHVTHYIPNTALLGSYTYYGEVGPYPAVWDSDSFNFNVQ